MHCTVYMSQYFQIVTAVNLYCFCWLLAILSVVVPMNGTGPVRYLFRVDPESKYLQLRETLSELCGTPANQIAFMDVGGGIVRVGGVHYCSISDYVCVL